MNQQLCSQCGETNRDGSRFCRKCGVSLSTVSATPQTFPNMATGRLPANTFLNNRYILLGKVGQGGMGAVYKAVDTKTDKTVAIKEMSNSAIFDQDEKARAIASFEREAELLTRLNHVHLPNVSDKFVIDDRHYLVMEFIEGQTLQEMLDEKGQFPEKTVLAWSRQLCDVLSYLHKQPQPIIFRDLKPDNIMLTRSGDVKLIDFGIVRFFKPGQQKDTVALGTLGYAAPEAFSGQTSTRSDIYSLGVTLFALLTGEDVSDYPPMQALPRVRSKRRGISADTDNLIATATAYNPAKRFRDARTMQLALLPSTVSPIHTPVQPPIKPPNRPSTGGIKTSRLTTQMLIKASAYTTRQLLTAGGSLLLTLLVVLWLVTPYLINTWLWSNVPTIAIIAPLAYAATRRRWAAAIAHFSVGFIGGIITWSQLDYATNSANLLIGAVASALVIEGMIMLLPKIMGSLRRDDPGAWQREAAWLGFTAIIGHIIFAVISSYMSFAINGVAWISAFLLGGLGWFVGDLIQGYLFLKQTGLKWRD